MPHYPHYTHSKWAFKHKSNCFTISFSVGVHVFISSAHCEVVFYSLSLTKLYLLAHLENATTINLMNRDITDKEYAAIIILRETRIDVVEAALIAKEALEKGHGKLQRARKCLLEGEKELRRQEKTVSFQTAVQEALEARTKLRARTQVDFRYFCNRMMRIIPGLKKRRIRSIRSDECTEWLEKSFSSLHQRLKARAILSGVFSTAIRRGWCDSNPISKVDRPIVRENTIHILTPPEINNLIRTASGYEQGKCLAAVGIMLYAGIRPNEVTRLRWGQVDLQEQAIYILPQHSKTGGARRVTIHKPLLQILQHHAGEDSQKICPPNWLKHWRELRHAAGWNEDKKWPQDALRHTFASYHLSHFRSFAELQLEIGHRDASLLRTRYVDQRGVQAAAQFWNVV